MKRKGFTKRILALLLVLIMMIPNNVVSLAAEDTSDKASVETETDSDVIVDDNDDVDDTADSDDADVEDSEDDVEDSSAEDADVLDNDGANDAETPDDGTNDVDTPDDTDVDDDTSNTTQTPASNGFSLRSSARSTTVTIPVMGTTHTYYELCEVLENAGIESTGTVTGLKIPGTKYKIADTEITKDITKQFVLEKNTYEIDLFKVKEETKTFLGHTITTYTQETNGTVNVIFRIFSQLEANEGDVTVKYYEGREDSYLSKLQEEIFNAVVKEDSIPGGLGFSNFTIQYKAGSTDLSWKSIDKELTDAEKTLNWHSFGDNSTEEIKISCTATSDYPALEVTKTIKLADTRENIKVTMSQPSEYLYENEGVLVSDILKDVNASFEEDIDGEIEVKITKGEDDVTSETYLTEGNYTVTASYEGNDEYKPAENSVNITVAKDTSCKVSVSYDETKGSVTVNESTAEEVTVSANTDFVVKVNATGSIMLNP